MAPPRQRVVARLVRDMIADGTLKAGGAVPSAAALARETGCHVGTCRAALRALVADGTLTRGVSASARLRVAQPGGACRPGGETLRHTLSRTLAARRRACQLTQLGLAGLLGVSVTTVGHAETGRYLGSLGDRLPQQVTACFVRSSLRAGRVICRTVRDADSRPHSSSGRYPSSLPLLPFSSRTRTRQPCLGEQGW